MYQHFDPDNDDCLDVDEMNAEFHKIDQDGKVDNGTNMFIKTFNSLRSAPPPPPTSNTSSVLFFCWPYCFLNTLSFYILVFAFYTIFFSNDTVFQYPIDNQFSVFLSATCTSVLLCEMSVIWMSSDVPCIYIFCSSLDSRFFSFDSPLAFSLQLYLTSFCSTFSVWFPRCSTTRYFTLLGPYVYCLLVAVTSLSLVFCFGESFVLLPCTYESSDFSTPTRAMVPSLPYFPWSYSSLLTPGSAVLWFSLYSTLLVPLPSSVLYIPLSSSFLFSSGLNNYLLTSYGWICIWHKL